jgi:hypothetical protein
MTNQINPGFVWFMVSIPINFVTNLKVNPFLLMIY